MRVFIASWFSGCKGETKKGLAGCVLAKDEDDALEKIANKINGEIRHTEDERSKKYVWEQGCDRSYFVKEALGWVIS